MGEIIDDEIRFNYNFYLSMADLIKLDSVREKCHNTNGKELEGVLWHNGLDINKPYQVVNDTHRCLSGEVHTTHRYLGFMRSDDKWKELFGSNIEVVLQALKTEIKYIGSEGLY